MNLIPLARSSGRERTKQNHVRGFFGYVRSGNVHGNTKVGLLESRRVVHAIASSGDKMIRGVQQCTELYHPHSNNMAECLRTFD